jgi:hypothetical protein
MGVIVDLGVPLPQEVSREDREKSEEIRSRPAHDFPPAQSGKCPSAQMQEVDRA